jgi:DNA-binding CsgD family transcriptional regulator
VNPTKTVQLLLLTLPVDRARARECFSRLRKAAGSLKIRYLGSFPTTTPVGLTGRQAEVLRGIAVGTSVKEIAVRLGISRKTVETHRASLMKRLRMRRIPELVRYAIQCGIVPASWLTDRR